MSTHPASGAGWQPDPTGRSDSRYWDGTSWTQAVMKDGNVDTDPIPVEPASPVAGMPSPAQSTLPGDMGPPPSPTDRHTSLSPAEAQARLGQMLSMNGFQVRQSTPGRLDASITAKGEPNWVIAVILCLLWLVPGIIYLVVKSKSVTHNVGLTFVPAENGTRIAIQADPAGMERLAPALAQLPW